MSKPAARRAPAKRAPRPWWRRMRWRRLILLVSLLFVLLFFLLVGVMYVFAKVPEPSEIARAQSVLVFDRHSQPIGRISAGADRVTVTLKEMPENLRNAVIATEDRKFYKHHGVRVTSIFRAALANLFRRGVEQGGSTITQQYVKNAFLGPQRTIVRKMKEAVLAIKFERKHTKDEILEDYLNTIYFGRGAYGCEAAASTYFGLHCRQLDLARSALLAGIIHAPEAYDPVHNPEQAKKRRDQVLDFMVGESYIEKAEADRVKKTSVRVRMGRAGTGPAPHFLEEVRRDLERRIGPGALYAGGVRVSTTLDLEMQEAANEAVKIYDRSTDPEAALVAVDPSNGEVRALVGSRDFLQREQDMVTQARRQPGSSFKPVVLTTAVREKMSTHDVFPAPSSITINGTTFSNYGKESFGSLDVEQATWHSVNTVYVQLMKKVGVGDAIQTARDLGIRSTLREDLGLALGDSEVTPLELVTMYSTLAARGQRHQPYLVARATDRSGAVIFRARNDAVDGIEPNVADRVTSVLQGVITNGTGRAAAIGRPAAGKTGTTDDYTDAWFAGYTPQLAAVVWNGYPESKRPMSSVHGRSVTGGSFPAQMWRRFMQRAHLGLPVKDFAVPASEPPASMSPSPSSSPSPSPSLPTPLPVVSTPAPKQTESPSPSPTPSSNASTLPSPSPLSS